MPENNGNVVKQGKPGYGKPPVEHQFKPGQSGNPKGAPKHRTQLWTHICRYMAMTPSQIRELDRAKLTISERTALHIVLKAQRGRSCGAERLARYAADRELGKAVEHLIIGGENDLTDDECQQIREELLKNADAD